MIEWLFLALMVLQGQAEAFLSHQELEKRLVLSAHSIDGSAYALSERGRIFISREPSLESWSVRQLPVEVALTDLARREAKELWVVGHQAHIFKSEDGGENWSVAFVDSQFDAPFFDIEWLSSQRGIAIGAYGLYLETLDGGQSWMRKEIHAENPHFYSLLPLSNGELLIVGEFGHLLKSIDQGETWSGLPSPYEGSFFSALEFQGEIFLMGLRSKLFKGRWDSSWNELSHPARGAWLTACIHEDSIFFGGLSGQILRWQNSQWSLYVDEKRKAVSSILCDFENQLVSFGEGFSTRISYSQFRAIHDEQ